MRRENESENRRPGQNKERQAPSRDIQKGDRSHGGSRQERERGSERERGGKVPRGGNR
jgi:hypothetical protein